MLSEKRFLLKTLINPKLLKSSVYSNISNYILTLVIYFVCKYVIFSRTYSIA